MRHVEPLLVQCLLSLLSRLVLDYAKQGVTHETQRAFIGAVLPVSPVSCCFGEYQKGWVFYE